MLFRSNALIAGTGRTVKEAHVDLGYRGVDRDNPDVRIVHRGKYKGLSPADRRRLKRRQAIEPAIGHSKLDHRMNRCYLAGATGDMLNALCCAVGYNLCWLMRALVRLKLAAAFLRLLRAIICRSCDPI